MRKYPKPEGLIHSHIPQPEALWYVRIGMPGQDELAAWVWALSEDGAAIRFVGDVDAEQGHKWARAGMRVHTVTGPLNQAAFARRRKDGIDHDNLREYVVTTGIAPWYH